MILSSEDDPGDTLRPRLEAHDADLAKVHFLTVETADGQFQQLNIEAHLAQLEDVLVSKPHARLLIFDPLTSYLGPIDSNSNTEVRRVLGPLCELAQRRRAAVLGVSHLTKKETRAVARTLGSMALVAAARANWLIVRDPKEPDRRLMLQAKNNLADAAGLAFHIRGGRVDWEPDPVTENVDAVSQQCRISPREMAEGFLERALEKGPLSTDDIMRRAQERGIRVGTLQRAKRELSVTSVKQGDRWFWALADANNTDTKVRTDTEE